MKGVLFTFDSFFALLILAAAIPLVITFMSLPVASPAASVASQADGAISALAELKVRNVIHEPAVRDMYSEGVITDDDLDKPVVDVIAAMWASNSTDNFTRAQNMTEKLLREILPSNLDFSVSLENNVLVDTGQAQVISASGRRVASGFMKGAQSSGYVASVFLTSIGGKRASSYKFFGGFVGQGNVSFNISNIPSDANITSIYMEMDVGNNFTLSINGNVCGAFNKTSGVLAADNWTIASVSCISNIIPGTNNTFKIVFSGDETTNQFVGGGFFRIIYNTNQLLDQLNNTRHEFPGIEGTVNYFDSFYIPGNLTEMSIRLKFFSEHEISLIIGNTTVFTSSGNASTQNVEIPDAELKTKLNYSSLSRKNVPLRLGATLEGTSAISGADAVLITSVSGSMSTCDIINGSLGLCGPGGNVTRLTAAKAADIQFAEVILNASGTRVASFGYQNNAPHPNGLIELSSNLTAVKTKINELSLIGQSQRCYACAIDEARRRLIPPNSSVPAGALSPAGPGSSYNKTRVVLLMSDGNANFCDNLDDAVGDYNQNCGETNAKKQAIDQACFIANNTPYTANGTSITVHTIAFGKSIDNSTLISIANCTGGLFFQSDNYTDLIGIYKRIGENITSISFIQQSANITGAKDSILYRDSYIEYKYVKDELQPGYQEIQIDQETGRFSSCNGSFFVPYKLRVIDAKLTSYSSNFWTSVVRFNNGTESVVFNISEFGNNFNALGDPFRIQILENLIAVNKTNNITVSLAANSSGTSSNCSVSNRVIYSARFRPFVPYGDVFPELSGGMVRVFYDTDHDGASDGFDDIAVGQGLSPFNNTVRTTDQINGTGNALDDAFVRLMDITNFLVTPNNTGISGTQNNPIDIRLSDINVDTTATGGIPFAWGPIDIRLDVKI